MKNSKMSYEVYGNLLNLELDKEEWKEYKEEVLSLNTMLLKEVKDKENFIKMSTLYLGELGVLGFIGLPLFYSYSNNVDINKDINTDTYNFILKHKTLNRLISDALWFVKDNSIYCTDILMRSTSEDETAAQHMDGTAVYTKANGEFEIEEFSIDEIRAANNWYEILFEKTTHEIDLERVGIKNRDGTFIQNNFNKHAQIKNPNRLQRAIKFLIMARSESYLPAKIAFYMSILEALFTNSKQEVGMQVRERTAKFIGNDINECIKIADVIKIAYGVRSSYVHGSVVTNKIKGFNSIEDLSIAIDIIIRRVLKLFLKEFNFVIEYNDSNFSKWINELTYSNIPYKLES